ncbi:MAG: dephospho-CoA kinase [Gammaproteobacteria bacterium]|nr:dephospho-CoA kinase [Gammaproteobacteria bacterium]
MLKIALTGGIASGKTTVSDEFAKLGVPVADADVIAREVVEPGSEALAALEELFGRDVIAQDGSLDRGALRKIIFSDKEKKRQVEAILHPAIHDRATSLFTYFEQQGAKYCIYVIPLLLETGQTERFDRILVIDSLPETQILRVMARDSVTREHALAILDAQANRHVRLAIAHDVIMNTGSIDDLTAQVRELHLSYLEIARQSSEQS